MEKYRRVAKVKEVTPINHNEIRVTTQGLLRNYLSYATTLLQDNQVEEIVLKAMGQAVSKTVEISEIIKQRIPNLHQDIAISSVSFVDVWEPIEEGLLQLETTRQVSMITITLSFKELNTNSPGYQAPSQNERQPRQQNYYQQSQAMQGRGGYNAVNDDSYGRGRGSWRGRGADRGQGWGRGGYGTYHDNRGYSNRGGGVGRGRNWGYQDDGGYQGGRGGYQQTRGGYQGGGGGYQHNRGGYQGGRGGYHEGGGGYQGNRGGYHEGGGGYQGGRGGYQGGRGSYQGGRGGYQGGRGGYPDGRRRYHDADGGEGGYDEGYGGYQGNRGGYQGARGGGRGYGRGRMGERSRGGHNDA